MADPLGVVRYGRDQMTEYEHMLASGSADVEPGMVLERVNDAGEIKVQPHSTDGGTDAQRFVAVEARDRGMSATANPNDGDAPDAYSTTGDNYPKYVNVGEGGGVHIRLAAGADLADASFANITATDKLVSAGDGTVRAFDSGTTYADDSDAVIFEAEESLDNSGAASGETVLLEVTTAEQA